MDGGMNAGNVVDQLSATGSIQRVPAIRMPSLLLNEVG